MLSIGLCQWYVNVTITILDIIHSPVFYLKDDVSEAGFWIMIRTFTVKVILLSGAVARGPGLSPGVSRFSEK
jgi:hypothetical protein